MNCLKDFKMMLFSESQKKLIKTTKRQKDQNRAINIEVEIWAKKNDGWGEMRVLKNTKALTQGLMQYLVVEMRQKSNIMTAVLMKDITALFLSLVLNCPKMFSNTAKTTWCVFSSTQLAA